MAFGPSPKRQQLSKARATGGMLPFGTPQQVRDAVVKAIDDTEGQLLVGSSTEVFDIVPLENYLALREAAMEYRF